MKAVKFRTITHAITKDSYPTMPHLASDFEVGDLVTRYKVKFRNGEHHIIGYLNDTNKVIEVPDMWTV